MPPHGISHSMGGHIDYVQTFGSKFSFSHEISSDFQKYKHDFMVTYAQECKNTLLPPVEVVCTVCNLAVLVYLLICLAKPFLLFLEANLCPRLSHLFELCHCTFLIIYMKVFLSLLLALG